MAFEDAGFCVVRGPDLLWGGDVRRFHPPPGRFDGVIGGPPCQAHSRLRHMVRHNRYKVAPDLIPEFERCLKEADPVWFLMENVPEAPLPRPHRHYEAVSSFVLRDHWCGGESGRTRVFTYGGAQPVGHPETLALHATQPACAALASGGYRAQPIAVGGNGKRKTLANRTLGNNTFRDHCRLQGLPEDFDLPPFLVSEKVRAVGNGVPLAMGRAVAQAVWEAVGTRG